MIAVPHRDGHARLALFYKSPLKTLDSYTISVGLVLLFWMNGIIAVIFWFGKTPSQLIINTDKCLQVLYVTLMPYFCRAPSVTGLVSFIQQTKLRGKVTAQSLAW